MVIHHVCANMTNDIVGEKAKIDMEKCYLLPQIKMWKQIAAVARTGLPGFLVNRVLGGAYALRLASPAITLSAHTMVKSAMAA